MTHNPELAPREVRHARRFVAHLPGEGADAPVEVDGVQFPDGAAALHWRGPWPTTTPHPSIDWIVDVHGHQGDTRLVWPDGTRIDDTTPCPCGPRRVERVTVHASGCPGRTPQPADERSTAIAAETQSEYDEVYQGFKRALDQRDALRRTLDETSRQNELLRIRANGADERNELLRLDRVRLAAVLRDVLGRFTDTANQGGAVVRTGYVDTRLVHRWHAVLADVDKPPADVPSPNEQQANEPVQYWPAYFGPHVPPASTED